MGLILYKVFIPIGVALGFGGGGLIWIMGDSALGKYLIFLGAVCGLSWGILGVMMSQYRWVFSVAWCIALCGMLARTTIWRDIKPNSVETVIILRTIDNHWNLLLTGLIAFMVMYVITWGQRIDIVQVRRRTAGPVYPVTSPHDNYTPPAPATGEKLAQPVVEAPRRESLMQRRARHLKIQSLLRQDRDIEARQLLRKGEYIVGDTVESDYD
jgi:hypothetical protein